MEKIAFTLSINNTMVFEKNEDDIKGMFMKDQQARFNYSKKIRSKEDITSNYFEEPEEK